MDAEGLTKAEIASQVGVGEATVYRVLAKARRS
ncbi:helix-turn-helix domain-containing protein [Nitrosospira sp. Nl5]